MLKKFVKMLRLIKKSADVIYEWSPSLYAFYRDENGDPRTPRGDSGKPPIDFDLRVRKWSENTIKTVILKLFFLYLHT